MSVLTFLLPNDVIDTQGVLHQSGVSSLRKSYVGPVQPIVTLDIFIIFF